MTGRVLLLSPSWGHGGEIERYTATVEWAFAAGGVQCQRLDPSGSGTRAHARLLVGWRGRVGHAAQWTRQAFALERYAQLAVRRLL